MRITDYDSISAVGYEARYQGGRSPGLESALAGFMEQRPNGKLLDIGTGTGHWLAFYTDLGCAVTGLDVSMSMLRRAQEKRPTADLVQATAQSMPFRDGAFARAVCVNVFHQFEKKRACLCEVHRVLHAGGKLMIVGLDPHTDQDRWWIYDYFPEARSLDRERYTGAEELRHALMLAGFAPVSTNEVHHTAATVPFEIAQARGHLERSFASQLATLSDEEYERGLERMRQAHLTAQDRGERLLLTTDLRLYATIATAVTR